jgi:hypothetical protein
MADILINNVFWRPSQARKRGGSIAYQACFESQTNPGISFTFDLVSKNYYICSRCKYARDQARKDGRKEYVPTLQIIGQQNAPAVFRQNPDELVHLCLRENLETSTTSVKIRTVYK